MRGCLTIYLGLDIRAEDYIRIRVYDSYCLHYVIKLNGAYVCPNSWQRWLIIY